MKKFIIPALLIVAAMSSCSKDEVTEVLPQGDNANVLGLSVSSGVTKGADVTTASLENNTKVKLYAVKTDKTVYTSDFTFDSGDWSSSDAPTWTALGLPGETVKFYSVHDGEGPIILDVSDTSVGATLEHTTSQESADHKDLVYYAGSLAAIPAGGKIQAYHKHALSKVNVKASTGDLKVYIARVRLVNADSKANAAMLDNSVTWTNNTDVTDLFNYYADANASNTLVASQFDDELIKLADTNPDILMVPQTLAATCKSDINDDLSDSYIEVIYCAEDKDGNPLVGYSEASKYPEYDNITNEDVTTTTPLYVKAAFPVSYAFVDDTAYIISLGLGGIDDSTGGLNLSDNYVDKDGNDIELGDKVDPDLPEEGDPIFPTGNTQIDITVKVCDWDSEVLFDVI
ncbi:MAG: hypothetical protein R3Y50_10940 [Rikenellaceae bacterium]